MNTQYEVNSLDSSPLRLDNYNLACPKILQFSRLITSLLKPIVQINMPSGNRLLYSHSSVNRAKNAKNASFKYKRQWSISCKIKIAEFLKLCKRRRGLLNFAIPQVFSYQASFDVISSVQLLSRVQLFAILWTAAHQASLSITNSQSLLKFMPIE